MLFQSTMMVFTTYSAASLCVSANFFSRKAARIFSGEAGKDVIRTPMAS